ncbi:hypothetical protein FH608_038575 [Nonomuraea phyllanthi]|uniref:Uncharacterized protein n=1 Tax=Nonomuraea phyllanthi TaxID=2219224 RepID=A0A5C4VMS0_9ACTN|nr:hypothetical protein [Nonomuraea phyllanthi]KAB8189511.1 hypothetical protein FH608_038575 [Nonomuraea phyllanthi]
MHGMINKGGAATIRVSQLSDRAAHNEDDPLLIPLCGGVAAGVVAGPSGQCGEVGGSGEDPGAETGGDAVLDTVSHITELADDRGAVQGAAVGGFQARESFGDLFEGSDGDGVEPGLAAAQWAGCGVEQVRGGGDQRGPTMSSRTSRRSSSSRSI